MGVGIAGFWDITEDFHGTNDVNGVAMEIQPFKCRDVSVGGSPTFAFVDGSERGELAIDMDTENEVQNLNLYQGDTLQFDIDKLFEISWRVKMNQAAIAATTQFSIGVTGDRNDTINSIAQAALFRMIGGTSTTAVVVETDDGTNETSLVATSTTLINVYKTLTINFAAGKSDIRFFIDGQPVAVDTTFSMAAYTGKLQLFAQIQKTANANANGFTIDWVEAHGRN